MRRGGGIRHVLLRKSCADETEQHQKLHGAQQPPPELETVLRRGGKLLHQGLQLAGDKLVGKSGDQILRGFRVLQDDLRQDGILAIVDATALGKRTNHCGEDSFGESDHFICSFLLNVGAVPGNHRDMLVKRYTCSSQDLEVLTAGGA